MGTTRKASEVIDPILEAGRQLNVGELAAELLQAFGGAARFAGSYKKEFDGSKTGSISRSKMLDGVLRVVAQASAQNKNRLGDTDQMTDEQLRDELLRFLAKGGASDAAPQGQ